MARSKVSSRKSSGKKAPTGVNRSVMFFLANEDNEVVGAHSGEASRGVYEGWIGEAL